MLVWISCLEHLEYRTDSRLASRMILNNGLCKRKDTRSIACGEMARKFSRVLPSRRTFAMSCRVHGSSLSWGNIGIHTSQSPSIFIACPPFLGGLVTFSAVAAAALRNREWFAGRLFCAAIIQKIQAYFRYFRSVTIADSVVCLNE